MKKAIIIIIYFALSISYIWAQNTQTGYYYVGNEKKEIPINQDFLLIYFNKSKINFEIIDSLYDLRNEVILNSPKRDTLYAFIVSISGNNYEKIIDSLKGKPYVYDVEPTIGEQGTAIVTNQFYVQLHSLADTIILKNMASQTMTIFEGNIIEDSINELFWYTLSTNKTAGDALKISAIYAESGYFKAVDPGFLSPTRNNAINRNNRSLPTDTYILDQWSITDLYDIWDEEILGNGVTIALIDDGVDTDHNEFSSLNFVSYDFHYGYYSNNPQILGSHGTNLAGIIFSDHDNGDIAGIAPEAELINIATFCTDYTPLYYDGVYDEQTFSALYSSLYTAYTLQADIVLCPLDYLINTDINPPSILITSVINNMFSNGRNTKGTIIISASGDNYDAQNAIVHPLNYDNRIIIVGASSDDHERMWSSCYGDELDIVAPGENILTTDIAYSTQYNAFLSLQDGSGVAAAHVAGVVALMLSANPNLTLPQIDRILKYTAYKSPDYTFSISSGHPDGTWNSELGYGEIQSARAVELAQYLSSTPNLVVKDISTDDGIEPSPYMPSFNSPSIVAKDVTNTNTVTEIWLDNSYKINVTLHNYSASDVIVNPSDVKLYSKIYKNGSLTWNSSFPYNSPHTPTSTTPVTISGNGGSHTFIIPITTPSQLPNGLLGTGLHIAFVVVIGNNQYEIHNYSDATKPINNFIAENRLVAGKQYNFYTEWDTPIFPFSSPTITPNPTNGQATIEVDWAEIPADAMIVVTDIYGNTILFDRFTASNYRLNLDGRASGTYYVYIVSEGKALCMNKIVVY